MKYYSVGDIRDMSNFKYSPKRMPISDGFSLLVSSAIGEI